MELTRRMTDQAKRFGAELRASEVVVDVDLKAQIKKIRTKTATYLSRAVILSIGTQREKLQVPGEARFLGRGVSYCPVCDGAFFRDLTTVVVGSDDEAAHDALFLAGLARKVLLISDKEKTEISESYRKKLNENNVQILLNTRIEGIEGNASVKKIKVTDTKANKERTIPVDGVFISLGRVPMTQIVRKAGIEVDERGCIQVDRQQRTNIDGVFAAGDCTCGGMQIVTATGEGAMAAMKAAIYAKRQRKS